MEGPLAPIQVAQEEARDVGFTQPCPPAPENLRFVWISLWLFKVIFSLFLLFWLWFVTLPVPVIVIQLLLQSLFQAQLLLRQSIQVAVLLIFPVSFPNAISA